MSKAVSGFPEWLPEGRAVELAILDKAREVFELHGFLSLETRSVEPLEVLAGKGEVDKEVYALRRLHGDAAEESSLALHFDLTVPFARYVLEHRGQLEFPMRRYQMQKVWRGERPQEGRYREFTQADIDVVGRGTLAFHHDIEMAVVMAELLAQLPIPPAILQVSNRKLAQGFYAGLGIEDPIPVLRLVDKAERIGPAQVERLLVDEAGLSTQAARRCLELAAIRAADGSVAERVAQLGVTNDLLEEGVAEVVAVVEGANAVRPGSAVADLRIARGLDYYTGTVYETALVGYEKAGSISSGGRYDSLAADAKDVYPGVGISLGVTRLVGILLAGGLVSVSRAAPSCVLIAVADEQERSRSDQVAAALRARGIPCEVAPAAEKYGKQIRYADRRGIPFVWFPDAAGDSVKDLRSGDQVEADAARWTPPRQDLHPAVLRSAKEASQ